MVLRADPAGVRPTGLVEALAPARVAGDARDASAARLFRIAIGRQLQAEVLDATGDSGQFVRIAGTVVQMDLPETIRPGDTLTMTLVAHEPRPTFLLQQPSAALPEISTAARLIAGLLGALAQIDDAPALEGGRPLAVPESGRPAEAGATPAADAPAPAIDPAKLAAALRQALTSSGAFYESHLRRWADNDFPLQDLLREPQSRIGRFLPTGADGATGSSGEQTTQTTQMTRLFGVQLDAHEHGRIAWQGDAWPGQPMRWTVERRDEESAAAPRPDASAWQSTVRVNLPSLGTVSATLRLHAGGLTMRVATDDAGSAATLRAQAAGLADALAASGLTLTGLAITQEDTPDEKRIGPAQEASKGSAR